MYRLFDHTADVGFHVEAETLAALFADSGRALVSVLVDDTEAFEPRRETTLECRADRLDDLLFDFLAELLYRFCTERFVPVNYDIDTDGERLKATLQGEDFDPDRHRGGAEVKAITYHGLKVERADHGYSAEIIVDL
jgi:SHS2 domain-containing protein